MARLYNVIALLPFLTLLMSNGHCSQSHINQKGPVEVSVSRRQTRASQKAVHVSVFLRTPEVHRENPQHIDGSFEEQLHQSVAIKKFSYSLTGAHSFRLFLMRFGELFLRLSERIAHGQTVGNSMLQKSKSTWTVVSPQLVKLMVLLKFPDDQLVQEEERGFPKTFAEGLFCVVSEELALTAMSCLTEVQIFQKSTNPAYYQEVGKVVLPRNPLKMNQGYVFKPSVPKGSRLIMKAELGFGELQWRRVKTKIRHLASNLGSSSWEVTGSQKSALQNGYNITLGTVVKTYLVMLFTLDAAIRLLSLIPESQNLVTHLCLSG